MSTSPSSCLTRPLRDCVSNRNSPPVGFGIFRTPESHLSHLNLTRSCCVCPLGRAARRRVGDWLCVSPSFSSANSSTNRHFEECCGERTSPSFLPSFVHPFAHSSKTMTAPFLPCRCVLRRPPASLSDQPTTLPARSFHCRSHSALLEVPGTFGQ